MMNPWNDNAIARHQQILSGKDITFSELLAPQIIRLTSKIADPNKTRLLEVGCGTGILAKMLAPYVLELVGIDNAPNCITLAKEHNKGNSNVQFWESNLTNIEEKFTNKFDIAVAHMVLHVLEDLKGALTSISQNLETSGAFIFTIPHPCFWAEIRNEFLNVEYSYMQETAYSFPFIIAKDKNPLESHVPYIHRPLERYFHALYDNNLRVEYIVEPNPNSNLSKKYSREWKYPGFLIFYCRKVD